MTHELAISRTPQATDGPEGAIDYSRLKGRIPVCDRTLRSWIRTGKIPSIKMPGSRRRLFFWRDVEAAMRRHTRGGDL